MQCQGLCRLTRQLRTGHLPLHLLSRILAIAARPELEEQEEQNDDIVHPECRVVYAVLVRAAMVCRAWREAALEAARHLGTLDVEGLTSAMPEDVLASGLFQRMAADMQVIDIELTAPLHWHPGFRQFLQGCLALERLTVRADGGQMDRLGQAFLESAIASVPVTHLECLGFVPVGPLPHTLEGLMVNLCATPDRAGTVLHALQLLLVSLQNAPSMRWVVLSFWSALLAWVPIDLGRVRLGDLQLPQLEDFSLSLINVDLSHGQVELGCLGCERSFVFRLGLLQCSVAAAFLAQLPTLMQPQDELRIAKCGLSSMQRDALLSLHIAHVQVDMRSRDRN